MKPSHTTTPRSLGECHFIPGHDPIERPVRTGRALRAYAVVVFLVGLAALLLVGARA